MEKIFNKVNNIRCGTSIQFTSDCKRRIMYTITDEEVGKSIIMVTIPKFIRPKEVMKLLTLQNLLMASRLYKHLT